VCCVAVCHPMCVVSMCVCLSVVCGCLGSMSAAAAAVAVPSPQHQDTPLILAAWKGHSAMCEKLLDAGADIEAVQKVSVLM